MATVVNFPRRPPENRGLGQLAGLLVGRYFKQAREKERARNTIKAFEAVTGQDIPDEGEEQLVDMGVSMEELAQFTAERRAAAQEERSREAHPLQQERREQQIESADIQQRRTEQQIRQSEEQHNTVEVTATNPDTGQQIPVRISREQSERGELPARLQRRGFRLGTFAEASDDTVEVTATNTETGREAKVRVSKEQQEKGSLPKNLKDQGWVLGNMSDAAQGGSSQKERLIRNFVTARGGDPENSKHLEQARAIIDERSDGVERIERTYGTETPSGFAFPGKRAKLANAATDEIDSIMWNRAMQGETIGPLEAANIAMQRAEEDLGPVGEPTPEEQQGQERATLEGNVEEAEEAGVDVPLFGGFGTVETDPQAVGEFLRQDEQFARQVGKLISSGKLQSAVQEIKRRAGDDLTEAQISEFVLQISSDE